MIICRSWKKISIHRLVLILTLFSFSGVLAWNKKDTTQIEKIKKILRDKIPEYFPKEIEIINVGDLKNGSKIVVTELIWGNLRSTKRLVLLSNEYKYLGNYGGFSDFPIKMENNKVIFDTPEEYGNAIDFSKGPPNQIYINGIFYDFDPVNK